MLDDLRRKIEDGRTTQLLACPRNIQHGTLEHAKWLLQNVSKDADVVNSASGYGKLAPPITEGDTEARAFLQDKAGASHAVGNARQRQPADILMLLAEREARHRKSYTFHARWAYCSAEWLLPDKGGRASHTCSTFRRWALPILTDSWRERLAQQAEDKTRAAVEDTERVTAHVTRLSLWTAAFCLLRVLLSSNWVTSSKTNPIGRRWSKLRDH